MLELTAKKSITKGALGKEKSSSRKGNGDNERGTYANTSTASSQSQPWIEKYRPVSVAEMKLYHLKQKAMKAWLDRHVFSIGHHGSSAPPPGILIMVGCSGSGKSTAMELLCQENGIEVVHWTDVMWDSTSSNGGLSVSSSSSGGRGLGNTVVADFLAHNNNRHNTHNHRSGDSLQLTHGLIEDLFSLNDNYINRGNSGYSGNSSTARMKQLDEMSLQCKYPSLSLSSKPTSSSAPPSLPVPTSNRGGRDVPSSSGMRYQGSDRLNKVLLVHDPFSLQFISQHTPLSGGSESSIRYASSNTLPESVCHTLLSCGLPIVMIVSDAIERDEQGSTRHAIVPTSISNRVLVERLYWTPPTENRIIKQLQHIIKSEQLPTKLFTDEILQEIAVSSLGDMRHAVLDLQFRGQCMPQTAATKSVSPRLSQSSTTTVSVPIPTTTSLSRSQSHISTTSSNGQKRRRRNILDEASDDEEWIEDYTSSSKGKGKGSKGSDKTASSRGNRGKGSSKDREVVDLLSSSDDDNDTVDTSIQILPTSTKNSAVTMTSNVKSTGSRDSSISMMHAIGKCYHAKLDRYGEVDYDINDFLTKADIGLDFLVTMLQSNAIDAIDTQLTLARTGESHMQAILDRETERLSSTSKGKGSNSNVFPLSPSMSEALQVTREALSIPLIDSLSSLELISSLFSDCDCMLSRKYDPSAHIDRSHIDVSDSSSSNSVYPNGGSMLVFPDLYVQHIASRVLAVGKGCAVRERYDAAKDIGMKMEFKGFSGQRMSKYRQKRAERVSHILSQRDNMQHMMIERYGTERGDVIQSVDVNTGSTASLARQYNPSLSVRVGGNSASLSVATMSVSQWAMEVMPCFNLIRDSLSRYEKESMAEQGRLQGLMRVRNDGETDTGLLDSVVDVGNAISNNRDDSRGGGDGLEFVDDMIDEDMD